MTPTDRLALQRLLERLRREQEQTRQVGPIFAPATIRTPLAREADRLVPVIEKIVSESQTTNREIQMEKRYNLNFGEAIEALKRGQRVTRPNWNGRGMYLWLLPAATVKAEWCKEPHLKALAEANGGAIEALGSIRMLTADKKVLTGWLASQTDMLADDWQILA